MIPLTILYDEYIDSRKLTEQNNPFDYIVPPPSPIERGRNNYSRQLYETENVKRDNGGNVSSLKEDR